MRKPKWQAIKPLQQKAKYGLEYALFKVTRENDQKKHRRCLYVL
jgi:hypothetical protein